MVTCDESYLRVMKNLCLFASIYERNMNGIAGWLDDGADINACDAKRNTPLHIAVRTQEKDIVKLLLDRGAIMDLKNSEGHTPKDLAEDLIESECRKSILEMLNTVFKEAKMVKSVSKAKNKKKLNLKRDGNVTPSDIQSPFMYTKREGTSGIAGYLYETKLLCLVLIRALNDNKIKKFYLGTNISGIKAADDICIRCEIEGEVKPVIVFAQAKHKENREKDKPKIENLRGETGDFSLYKYFDSYLKIKEKFKPDSDDVMFRGEFNDVECVFVIYTSSNDNLNKLEGNLNMNVHVRDILQTGKLEHFFQWDYHNVDIALLAKIHNENEIKELSSRFLKYIMDKPLEMFNNELIAKYHVAMRREMINVIDNNMNNDSVSNLVSDKTFHMARFNPVFFSSTSKHHIIMLDTFYKEMSSSCYDKSVLNKFINFDSKGYQNSINKIEDYNTVKTEILNKIKNVLRDPCADTISMVISKIVTYNNNSRNLEVINGIADKLKNDQNFNSILHSLSEKVISYAIITEAIREKLKAQSFKLPILFGNFDMHISGNVNKRLDKISDELVTKILKTGTVSKSDEHIGSHKTIIEVEINGKLKKILAKGILDTNGGLGGAVGNILILDEETNMMKFDIKSNMLPNAKALIGKLTKIIDIQELHKYRLRININKFPKYSFEVNENDTNHAKDFLQKLYFFTNQAKQNEVEEILKQQIKEDYIDDGMICQSQLLLKINSDAIFLRSHDEIQKWWMQLSRAPYLSKDRDIFREAKNYVTASPLLTILHFIYINKVIRQIIVFKNAAIHALQLDKPERILNIVSVSLDLSGMKIRQYFGDCIFIDFNDVLCQPVSSHNILINELAHTNEQNLVIIYNGYISRKRKVVNKLLEILETFKKKIIIVTNYKLEDVLSNLNHEQTHIFSVVNESCLMDLDEDSINKILSVTKVNYQGSKIAISSIIGDKGNFIRDELFTKFYNGNKVNIGKDFIDDTYKITSNYFVDRFLSRYNSTYKVKSLDDINDQVVICSAAAKSGKSCLLSHMSSNTKRNNPTHWIVRINLQDHENVFQRWRLKVKEFCIHNAIQFIFYVAMANIKSLDNDFAMTEIREGILCLQNLTFKSVARFELELFLHFYNTGKVIFLFDDFSAICPHYEREVMNLLNLLKSSGNRMWITTCSNRHPVIALEREFGTAYVLDPLNKVTTESRDLNQSHVEQNKLDVILHYLYISALEFINAICPSYRGKPMRRFTSNTNLIRDIANIIVRSTEYAPKGIMIYRNFKCEQKKYYFPLFHIQKDKLLLKCKQIIAHELRNILWRHEIELIRREVPTFICNFSTNVINRFQSHLEWLHRIIETSALSELPLKFPSEYCDRPWSSDAVPELIQTVYSNDVDSSVCFTNALCHAIMTEIEIFREARIMYPSSK